MNKIPPNIKAENTEQAPAYAMWLAERLQVRLDSERKNLRASQVRTFEKTIEFLKQGKLQGLIKQPTGAGKTRIFGEMLAGINLPSLILVPRRNLIKDTKNEMVGNEDLDIDGLGFLEDEVLTLDPINTSAKIELERILKSIERIIEKRGNFGGMTIMTYQSFLNLAKNNKDILSKLLSKLNVVVSDEAHRSLGEETRAALENLNQITSETHHEKKQQNKKIVRDKVIEAIAGEESLSEEALKTLDLEEDNEVAEIERIIQEEFQLLHLRFTATPRLSEKEVQEVYDIPIIDWVKVQDLLKTGDLILPQMPQIGNAIYNIPDEEEISINDGYLGDLVSKNKFVMEDGRLIQEAVTDMYLKKKEASGNYLPGVAFCETIEQAERYKQYLISKGIRAVRCTSANKDYDIGVSPEHAKKMFHENSLDVVVTVSKVGEGWDVPTLRCALWLTVTHSPARAMQGNGRIMRKLKDDSPHSAKSRDNTFIIEPNWMVKRQSSGKNATLIEMDETQDDENKKDKSSEKAFESSNFYELLLSMNEVDMTLLREFGLNEFIRYEDLMQANKEGFFEKDGVKYGTCEAWQRKLGIHSTTILNRVKKDNKKILKGKDSNGLTQNFYSELDVRDACKDLLEEDLLQANKEGFFEKDGIKYGTCGAWYNLFGISGATIFKKLTENNIEGINGKASNGVIQKYYPEAEVKEVCKDYMQLDLLKANKEGFFTKDGTRYATISAWKRILNTTEKTITNKISETKKKSIKGKDSGGKIQNFYSESDVLDALKSDVKESLSKAPREQDIPKNTTQENFPQANQEGFFEKDGMKYGTCSAWYNLFGISGATIFKKLTENNKVGIKGKNLSGPTNNFYSESDVRDSCKDILNPDLTEANDEGFIIKDKLKYGTSVALARIFGISSATILTRLVENNKFSIKGKISGTIYDFYLESDAKEVCIDLIDKNMPQGNSKGFIEKDNVQYGTCNAWERSLGISAVTIATKLKENQKNPIKGKDIGSRILYFYSELDVKEVCKDLLKKDLLKANDEGYIEKNGIKYRTVGGWEEKLGISSAAIQRRLKKNIKDGIKGKDLYGHLRDFYSESEIREACADLLGKK